MLDNRIIFKFAARSIINSSNLFIILKTNGVLLPFNHNSGDPSSYYSMYLLKLLWCSLIHGCYFFAHHSDRWRTSSSVISAVSSLPDHLYHAIMEESALIFPILIHTIIFISCWMQYTHFTIGSDTYTSLQTTQAESLHRIHFLRLQNHHCWSSNPDASSTFQPVFSKLTLLIYPFHRHNCTNPPWSGHRPNRIPLLMHPSKPQRYFLHHVSNRESVDVGHVWCNSDCCTGSFYVSSVVAYLVVRWGNRRCTTLWLFAVRLLAALVSPAAAAAAVGPVLGFRGGNAYNCSCHHRW